MKLTKQKMLKFGKKNTAEQSTGAGLKHGKSASAISNLKNQMQQQWDALSFRDQVALSILGIFFVLLIGGYGGYSLNQAAKEAQKDYQTAVSDYFWLRNQAGNINPNSSSDTQTASLDSEIKQQLTQAGASNPQVVIVGNGAQLTFQHNNPAVISSIMSNLAQQGLSISRLVMQQNPATQSIQVQATVNQ